VGYTSINVSGAIMSKCCTSNLNYPKPALHCAVCNGHVAAAAALAQVSVDVVDKIAGSSSSRQ